MPRSPPPPLDAAALERLALRYVERFATTRGRLADYLRRKLRERGHEGPAPDPAAIAEAMAARGYVDDRAFAEMKAAAMARRGLGPRRAAAALSAARVSATDRDGVVDDGEAAVLAAALVFARRRRIGPFAVAPADAALQRKQVAALIRAGHAPSLAKRVAAASSLAGLGDDGAIMPHCDDEQSC